jgi:hypothetical protein
MGTYTVLASASLWLLGLFLIARVREDRQAHADRLAGLAGNGQEA